MWSRFEFTTKKERYKVFTLATDEEAKQYMNEAKAWAEHAPQSATEFCHLKGQTIIAEYMANRDGLTLFKHIADSFLVESTLRPIREIRTDYIDDENLQHIDVYFTDDDNEQGTTAAVVDLDTGKVIYFDNIYRNCENVTEAIKDIVRGMLRIWM